jgi:hypothetical protein
MAFITAIGGVSITSTGTTTLAEIAWFASADGSLSSPVCILHVTPSDLDAMDIHVFDTAAASIIGTTTVAAGGPAAVISFSFTVPAGDTTLILETARPASTGTDPVVTGARAEFVD